MFTVYMIWCEATEMLYVGCTKLSADERWRAHVRAASDGSRTRLHEEVRLLGPEAFECFVLCTCETAEEAVRWEMLWIAHTSATDTSVGYNERTVSADQGSRSARAAASERRRQLGWSCMTADQRREYLRECGRKGAEASRVGRRRLQQPSA